MSTATCVPRIGDRSAEARLSQRTNMFLAAVLQGSGFSAPVKVRNMSASGAMAEAAAVPEVGAVVRLVRGSLSVPAAVVWSSDSRCGLRFSSVVSVHDWLATPRNAEQQRVDDVVRLVKAGAVPLAPVQRSNLEISPSRAAVPAELPDELRRVCALLTRIGENLLDDEAILAKHGSELQNLDICTQTIEAVADLLGGDRHGAGSRLATLRVSCEQALDRGAP